MQRMNHCPNVVLVCVAALNLADIGYAQCPAMTNIQRTGLTAYVQKRFKVPRGMTLEVKEISSEPGCYRKLLFSSTDRSQPFRSELFVSPDFRFLSRELMDSH